MSLGRWRARQLAGAFCHWRDLASDESWQRQVLQHFAARRQQQLLVDAFSCLKRQVGSHVPDFVCCRRDLSMTPFPAEDQDWES